MAQTIREWICLSMKDGEERNQLLNGLCLFGFILGAILFIACIPFEIHLALSGKTWGNFKIISDWSLGLMGVGTGVKGMQMAGSALSTKTMDYLRYREDSRNNTPPGQAPSVPMATAPIPVKPYERREV